MFDAADSVMVVSDGRLSPALPVADYAQIEALATAVTRLERHGTRGAGPLRCVNGRSQRLYKGLLFAGRPSG